MSLIAYAAQLHDSAPFLTSNRLFGVSAALGVCSAWLLWSLWKATHSAAENEEYIILLEARDAWRRALAEKDVHKDTNANILQLIEDALRLYDEQEEKLSVSSRASSTASFFSYGESIDALSIAQRPSVASLEETIETFEFGAGETATGIQFLEEGLSHAQQKTIKVRTDRAKMVNVASAEEYCAKVYCLRIAFDRLFSRKPLRKWFQTNGQLLLARVLKRAGKDTADFNRAFDDMCKYLSRPSVNVGNELRYRGVVHGGFFDVGLDFVLMDAFDDLSIPPQAVSAVLGNKWLPSAVVTKTIYGGVYTIVKAKSAASSPDTFPYYFYELCATMTPTLASGFLGPDPELKHICEDLRDVVMNYLKDIFSHEEDRYASAERLEKELFLLAKKRMADSEALLE